MDYQKKIRKVISNGLQKLKYSIHNNKESVHFILKFCIITTLFFTVYYLLIDYLQGLLFGTAWLAGTLANSLGISVTINGVLIDVGPTTLEIIPECTGIFAIFVTISCILSYPADITKKGIGILIITPMILLLNLLRLIILIIVGKYFFEVFEYVHSYLWQATFIIFIIFAWFLWIDKVVKK